VESLNCFQTLHTCLSASRWSQTTCDVLSVMGFGFMSNFVAMSFVFCCEMAKKSIEITCQYTYRWFYCIRCCYTTMHYQKTRVFTLHTLYGTSRYFASFTNACDTEYCQALLETFGNGVSARADFLFLPVVNFSPLDILCLCCDCCC
jgi:hypothetical protein